MQYMNLFLNVERASSLEDKIEILKPYANTRIVKNVVKILYDDNIPAMDETLLKDMLDSMSRNDGSVSLNYILNQSIMSVYSIKEDGGRRSDYVYGLLANVGRKEQDFLVRLLSKTIDLGIPCSMFKDIVDIECSEDEDEGEVPKAETESKETGEVVEDKVKKKRGRPRKKK